MKRILFVDDEAEILAGLRSMLEHQKTQWEMEFAGSCETTLGLLESAPFDVIVSDVSMPGMSGAALLKTICDKYPAVVRILLSNQAELEEALRTVPVAHQFLLKPCDMHMLRVAIEGATSLSNVLQNKMLISIVGSVKDLPVLPKTYLALREKLAESEVQVRDVVHLVE